MHDSKESCAIYIKHTYVNPILTGLCHAITEYGLIQPIAGRKRANHASKDSIIDFPYCSSTKLTKKCSHAVMAASVENPIVHSHKQLNSARMLKRTQIN